jgi:hypothetical protein
MAKSLRLVSMSKECFRHCFYLLGLSPLLRRLFKTCLKRLEFGLLIAKSLYKLLKDLLLLRLNPVTIIFL